MKIQSKIWLWVISILLIANLVLAGFQFFGSKGFQPPADRPFLGEQLNFDTDQTAELKLLMDQHQYQMKTFSDSIRINKDQFFRGLSDGKTVDEQSEFAENIAHLEVERDKFIYLHFQAIRELCSDAQKSKFDKLLREIMHPQGKPGGKGGPGRMNGPPPMGMDGDRNMPPPPMGMDGDRNIPPHPMDENRGQNEQPHPRD